MANNTEYKVLGSDDSVTTCDCCGKSGLKVTFAVEMTSTGEILRYGSVCVTRNTGIKNPTKAAYDYHLERMKMANIKLRQSAEYRALEARYALRLSMKMLPGLEALKFVKAEYDALAMKRKELIAEFNLQYLY